MMVPMVAVVPMPMMMVVAMMTESAVVLAAFRVRRERECRHSEQAGDEE
jgi:hypothetical protein